MISMHVHGDYESFDRWIGDTYPHIMLAPWQEEVARSVFSCRTFFTVGHGGGKTFLIKLLEEYASEFGLKAETWK